MAVTGLTRNQFIGVKPVRGFESLRLRWNFESAGVLPVDFFTFRTPPYAVSSPHKPVFPHCSHTAFPPAIPRSASACGPSP